MANSSQSEPQERYESLHQLQSPTAASGRYPRGSSATAAGNGDGKNGSAQAPYDARPERPGKLAKMVRMASQLIVHGRTTSSNSITTRGKPNYGSTDSIPRVTRGDNEHALVDDDDEDPWQEEPWGQWRLMLLTLGLAGAQLTWTVELG